ncbi:MAG: type II toxin-antitoxin system Phd/YefM family antitoxin [Syntrophaceae bacterium]
MQSGIKYSEDIVPISELKVNPGRIINQVGKTRRPVLVTSRGKGVAIVESLKDYEAKEDEKAFLQSVVRGLMDLEEGREVNLVDVKKRFGMSE